jgi:YggT family protein
LLTLVRFISTAIQVYQFLIFVRVILSFLALTTYSRWLHHPVVQLLHRITDPVLVPLRRIIPPLGAVDISPAVALILLEIVNRVVVGILLRL